MQGVEAGRKGLGKWLVPRRSTAEIIINCEHENKVGGK